MAYGQRRTAAAATPISALYRPGISVSSNSDHLSSCHSALTSSSGTRSSTDKTLPASSRISCSTVSRPMWSLLFVD